MVDGRKRTAEAFVKYAETCFKAFGDRVKHWITFNETVMFCGLGYLKGASTRNTK